MYPNNRYFPPLERWDALHSFFSSQCIPHFYCNRVGPIDILIKGKVQSAQIIILCFSCFHKTSITKLKICADIPCAKFQGTKFS